MPKRTRISNVGDNCRHCLTPVVRAEHEKPPKYKPGGYYFEWWLKCRKCKALYMQESAKRYFDPPAPEVSVMHFTREEIENQDGPPPW